MKIVSSCIEELVLERGACHTISFKSSITLMKFRQLIVDFFKRQKIRESETDFLKILTKDGNSIKKRDIYPIIFDCNNIRLTNDRDTKRVIQDFLENQLTNNPNLLERYVEFKFQLEKFLSSLGITSSEVVVDFGMSDKTITQLVRSLAINIDSNYDEEVHNHSLRIFLIKLLLELNFNDKEVLLIITYPESEIGVSEYKSITEDIAELNVTTIIFTSKHEILLSAPKENIFLIDEKGKSYDMIGLEKELIEFDLVQENKSEFVAKRLAYIDFIEEFTLLDNIYKKFLLSSKFNDKKGRDFKI